MRVPTLIARLLVTALAVAPGGHAWAQATDKDEAVPVQRGETIRRGDLLVSRMAVLLKDGARTDEMEASSFEALSSKPVLDTCHFEVVKSERKPGTDERNFPPQALDSLQVKTDVPEFDILAFLEKLRPSAEDLFSQVVDIDDLAGPVFKREDLKERLRLAFLAEPYTRLPRSVLSSVEQSIVTHIRGYWGDVRKMKGQPPDEARAGMVAHRARWIAKLKEKVRGDLKSEARARIQSLKSDQLTKTKVVLNFNFEDDRVPTRSKIECWFEGEKAKLTLQRLNAVIGPYFELVPKSRHAIEAAASEPKRERGVAVDGQAVHSW